MSLQSPHSSKIPAVGTHVPVVISFPDTRMSSRFSARARIESRGGERVGVDAASTTQKPFFNDNPRRKSQSSLQVGPPRRSHSEWPRRKVHSVSLPFARSLASEARTDMGTRARSLRMCPSRSRCRRSSTARTRGILNDFVSDHGESEHQSSYTPR